MLRIPHDRFQAFAEACRKAAQYGLLACSSGNLSERYDGEHMLVSASQTWLAELRPDQVAVCRIADASPVNGLRPSIETRFHAGILRARPEARVVLHFQSPMATALACRAGDLPNLDVIPEIPRFVGEVGVVPYLHPGGAELAEAVVDAMRTHNLALLRNHGQVTIGASFNEAIERAVFFELACRIVLLGGELTPLPPEVVRKFRAAGGAV